MSRWVLVKTAPDEHDRYTGRHYPFVAQHGKTVPFLASHAPLNRPWVPIPDALAWSCAQAVIAAGGDLGVAERRVLGLDLETAC